MLKPPAAAVPAPEFSRNFLVYLDWNQANNTRLAENIIQSAVKEAKRAGKVRPSLTSHADRSGTSRYNQRLSMRRVNEGRNGLN